LKPHIFFNSIFYLYYADITKSIINLKLNYLDMPRKINLDFETAINGLNRDFCPFCKNPLNYDIQLDSIYISCNCGNFDLSVFRDKFNGDLLLYYLNNANTGYIAKNNLKKLQKILYQKREIQQKLFFKKKPVKNQLKNK